MALNRDIFPKRFFFWQEQALKVNLVNEDMYSVDDIYQDCRAYYIRCGHRSIGKKTFLYVWKSFAYEHGLRGTSGGIYSGFEVLDSSSLRTLSCETAQGAFTVWCMACVTPATGLPFYSPTEIYKSYTAYVTRVCDVVPVTQHSFSKSWAKWARQQGYTSRRSYGREWGGFLLQV